MDLIQKYRFKDIQREDFQKCINKYENDLSWSSLSAIRSVATILSDYALSLDIIPHSYATKLLLPKKNKAKKEIFSYDEITAIMNAEGYDADNIKLMLFTGMRISEFLSVKTEDIIDGFIHCHGTKTENAERIIPIHPAIEQIIKSRDSVYLVEYNGKTIRQDTFREYHYYPALENIGVSRINPHGCRHWFFSQMDKVCPDKYAMTLIGGHSDSNFTEKVYVTADYDRLKDAINSIKFTSK